jgi:hypothetical protein
MDRAEAPALLGGLMPAEAKRIGASVFNSAQGEVVMKRHPTATNTGTVKASASPDTQIEQAASWNKPEKRSDAPAPPPVWTRYIDSRLKQFCVR